MDPNAVLIQHLHNVIPSSDSTPTNTQCPSLIADNNDVTVAPPACTCAQHCSQQWVHLINLVITEALMPMINLNSAASFPPHSYVSATRALLTNAYGGTRKATTPFSSNSLNFIGAIIEDITGDVLEYCHLIKSDTHQPIWQKSFANELGCLFQGIRDIKGTDTCFLIHRNQMPKHKRAIYGRICCNY